MPDKKNDLKDKSGKIKEDKDKDKDNLLWLESENMSVDEPIWLDD